MTPDEKIKKIINSLKREDGLLDIGKYDDDVIKNALQEYGNFISIEILKLVMETEKEKIKEIVCFANNKPGMHYECDCNEQATWNESKQDTVDSIEKILKNKLLDNKQ